MADDDARLVRLENKVDDVQTNMARRDDLIRLVDGVAKVRDEMIPRKEFEARHLIEQQRVDALVKEINSKSEDADEVHRDLAKAVADLKAQVLPQWAVTGLVTVGAGYALYRIAVPHGP